MKRIKYNLLTQIRNSTWKQIKSEVTSNTWYLSWIRTEEKACSLIWYDIKRLIENQLKNQAKKDFQSETSQK